MGLRIVFCGTVGSGSGVEREVRSRASFRGTAGHIQGSSATIADMLRCEYVIRVREC